MQNQPQQIPSHVSPDELNQMLHPPESFAAPPESLSVCCENYILYGGWGNESCR